jgi:2-(1,2-epoxy-1,2-dihydrophenyl)acetyl-CoA isomerase
MRGVTAQTAGAVDVSREGSVATVLLSRPDKLNAFGVEMASAIADAIEVAGAGEGVRAIVVIGEGRGFCAGADIAVLNELVSQRDEKEFRRLLETGERAIRAIRELPVPVIAAINGPAAGGGANLALSCDLRIMADNASIGQTFTRIGLHPDWGGTYLLPRLVGEARALELMWSGRMVGAEEALEIGLVHRVVSADRLAEDALAWARQLAAAPPLAVARIKRAVYESLDADLDTMLAVELENQLECFRSEDVTRGLFAFHNKETPRFEGR